MKLPMLKFPALSRHKKNNAGNFYFRRLLFTARMKRLSFFSAETNPQLAKGAYLHCPERINQHLTLPAQIEKLFRDLYYGGNWTSVNVKGTVLNVSWQQATTKLESFNTIAALVYHMNYYVSALIKVLRSEQLDARDKYSFDH